MFIMKEFKYEFIMDIMFMYIRLFTAIASHATYGTNQSFYDKTSGLIVGHRMWV
jgi:hypothetical protein